MQKPNVSKDQITLPKWMTGDPLKFTDSPRDWPGMKVERRFTVEGTDAFDTCAWESCVVELPGSEGRTMRCLFPKHFSERARKIVADKYLKKCENSNGDQDFGILVERIVDQIIHWGSLAGYYASTQDAINHAEELKYLLIHQLFAFNSPVWFNFGIEGIDQQGSACFIVPVEDTMEDISKWYETETRIFKRGSGSGADVSRLRSSYEDLSLGGRASGPVSFMKPADANAGVIKSGGVTRRAAKMVTMRCDHPDILEQRDGTPGFIRCKAAEEKRAHVLIDSGQYSGMFNVPGNAYEGVFFQNANHSVRLTDEFMRAYESDGTYWTKLVKTGEPHKEYSARAIMREIAEATWFCGDPGVQFDDTINRANTCANSFWIWGSNPCCFVGDTLVDTSEGRIQFSDLERMSREGHEMPHVFSFDLNTELPTLSKINKAWVAGHTKSLVEVKTDKGITVRCTPQHLWLTKGGKYVQAKDLKPGTRLRKIGRWINEERSGRRCINHRETDAAPNGMVFQSRLMWESACGPIPEGYEVHHKNGDATDDRLSNFVLRESHEHRVEHSSGASNPRYIDANEEELVRAWESVEQAKGKVSPSLWNKHVYSSGLNGIIPLARYADGVGRIRGMDWDKFSEFIGERQCAANDRVESVRIIELDEAIPVFDLEAEGTHNFAVANEGVTHTLVVHNSEYVSRDDTACNLASLNLLKFVTEEGSFHIENYRAAIDHAILAMEIIVGGSDYPTPEIDYWTKVYRNLGLGHANLGALLMVLGLPYDSAGGRGIAAMLASYMTARAYTMSTKIAGHCGGSFADYERNKDVISSVMRRHYHATTGAVKESGLIALNTSVGDALMKAAVLEWDYAIGLQEAFGLRNANVTLEAPTGTISFIMDCDTTGIEPAIGLVIYKNLVGGGVVKIVNNAVPDALYNLGYTAGEVIKITDYIIENGTVEGCDLLKPEHRGIFVCAFSPNGGKTISADGHLKMLGALQPFVSMAISKTVNMPESATVEDIESAYYQAWKLGIKCVAIYRDGCKRSQPVQSNETPKPRDLPFITLGIGLEDLTPGEVMVVQQQETIRPIRERLPSERASITHKIEVGGHEGYVNVGLYPDGRPGELFVTMSKEGSTVAGLLDAFATSVSLGLQYGVPLDKFIDKFSHMRFEPAGFTGNKDIPIAKSIIDYIFRWLELRFINGAHDLLPEHERLGYGAATSEPVVTYEAIICKAKPTLSGPECQRCFEIMQIAGKCYVCPGCGDSSGCS